MEEDSEFSKLSVEEKCLHKLWKARVSAYTDLDKLFLEQSDDKSQEFNKYSHLFKNIVIDNNVLALEKGLKATLTFMEHASCANKICGDVISGIVNKCLGSPKEKIKDLAMQIIYIAIEIEKYDVVQAELMKGMENKSPKTVIACIVALTNSLKYFGPKVINLKPIFKILIRLLEDRDKLVRENAKILVIEIYRWIKDSLKTHLSKLKVVQLNELEAEFVKIKDDTPKPTRYIRSMQTSLANQLGENDSSTENNKEQIDPTEFLEEINLFEKLPKDFYANCQSTKWQDRKEALEKLVNLISNIKLTNGDYNELIKILKKIVGKDSNILVVVLGTKSLTALAKALRKNFSPYAPTCIPVLLEKFREKKQNVVQSLRDAVDAIFLTISLEAAISDIQAALENKNPQIKMETSLFLARYFTTPPTTLLSNKKLLKNVVSALLKTLSDTDPSVRDASAEALGKLLKVAGENVIRPFLQDVEPNKLAKIKEISEKGAQPNKKASPSKKLATPSQSNRTKSTAKTPLKASKLSTRKASRQVVQSKSESKASKEVVPEAAEEKNLGEEEVQSVASDFLGAALVGKLSDPGGWKTRLEAVAAMKETVQAKPDVPVQALVKFLVLNKGLKEINQQVLKSKLELLNQVLTRGKVSRWALECCFPDLVEKIGDAKLGELVFGTLTLLAKATSLAQVSQEVLQHAFTFKSPKIQAEALNWVASALKEFGLKMPTKNLVENLKMAFVSTNALVRTAALNLLGVLSWYTGPSIRANFDTLKPTLLQQIDLELSRRLSEKPPALPDSKESGDSMLSGSLGIGAPIIDQNGDSQPRKDIGHLVSSLPEDLSNKDWKVRSAALSTLISILEEAQYIRPNLNGLPNALCLRLKDLNKNIVAQAQVALTALGKALGPHCQAFAQETIPAMFGSLADSKLAIRSQAIKCLSAWMETLKISAFSDMICEALRSESMMQRIGVLQVLIEALSQKGVGSSDIEPLLNILFGLGEDRGIEVRKKTQEVLGLVIGHVGFEFVHKVANKSKHKTCALDLFQKLKSSPSSDPKPVAPTNGRPPSTPAKPRIEKPKTAPTRPKSSTQTKDEEANKPQLAENKLKEQRIIDEKILKCLKWNFVTPQEEHVQQLKKQMISASWGPVLFSACFHSDFKFYLRALEILNEYLQLSPKATVSNLDLILKWCTLRLSDNNSTVLIHSLEYLHQLIILLSKENYILLELEASSFLPFLISKLGDPKDAVRKLAKTILFQLPVIYPESKIQVFIVQALHSKNSRQRAECLEVLGTFFEQSSIKITAQYFKEIAKLIADKDCGVRNEALNCIVKAYRAEGAQIFKLVGPLPEKSQSLLDERLKRAANDSLKDNLQRSLNSSHSQSLEETSIKAKYSPLNPSVIEETAQQVKFESDLKAAIKVNLMPELIKVNPREIFDRPEIKLPETKSVFSVATLKEKDVVFNMKILQLMESDLSVSTKAFVEMESLINSDPLLVKPHIRRILMNGSLQMKLTCTRYLPEGRHEINEVVELLKAILKCLTTIFNHSELASQISESLLQELLPTLIKVMLNEDLAENEVVRGINVIILRIFQYCQPNYVMSVLIRLLSDPTASPSEKFQDLVLKCLYKMIKMLDQHAKRLDLQDLMDQLNTFLMVYPSSYWKTQPSNKPLKAIKTYLFTLVKYRGNEVYHILKFIPGLDQSDLEVYIKKILFSLQQENYTSDGLSFTVSQEAEMLTKIFQKVISAESSEEGLLELYHWLKKHPGTSLEEILGNTTLEYQQDIKDKLEAIKKEESNHQTSSNSVLTSLPNLAASDRPAGYAQHSQIPFLVQLPQHFEKLTSQELIDWLKSVAQVLKQDETKYNNPHVLSQIHAILENNHFQSLPFSKDENELVYKNLDHVKQLAEEFKNKFQENFILTS